MARHTESVAIFFIYPSVPISSAPIVTALMRYWIAFFVKLYWRMTPNAFPIS